MTLSFFKYQGTGNDFVIIDNRVGNIFLTTEQVRFLCDRRFGIGADGLMLLETHSESDFRMVYFNSDGQESSMCGNGGRCIVHFAKRVGQIEQETTFVAIDGVHFATVSDDFVRLKMIATGTPEQHPSGFFLNTGSPHVVCDVADVAALHIAEKGAAIRYSDRYGVTGGVNVNFVEVLGENLVKVRTYERGVEAETLSCGTGVTAVALTYAAQHQLTAGKIAIQTPGGQLAVSFQQLSNGGFEEVYLEGPATFVFKGEIAL